MNLTAARTPEARVSVLVAAVLPTVALVEGPTLIDVGSGNGSPGIVLGVLRPDLEVTLLEPRVRRWAFLREVVRLLGLPQTQVLRARHDDCRVGSARTVTVRGVRLALPELARLVEDGGRLLVLGATPKMAGPFLPEPAGSGGMHVFRRCSTGNMTVKQRPGETRG